MYLHWMFFLLMYFLYCYHTTNGNEARLAKVPIVFNHEDNAKRAVLKKRQNPKKLQALEKHEGYSLQVLISDAKKVCSDAQSSTDWTGHVNNTALLLGTGEITEYIPEYDDPVYQQGAARVKRWGHHHHHHKKPVSLDFGCNSDNFHEHLTKQHDASGSSDGITSAPSIGTSSSDDNTPLSLFIKRPHHYQHRPHHHGPSITFRCNAHNHHIFKHFRRRSS